MTEQAMVPWARDARKTLPERAVPFALAAFALAATGAAVYVTAVSRHAPQPETHAALSVVVCLSFVGAGLFALRRQQYARSGVLLAAVGLSSLLGALHDANDAVVYTIGVLTANLVFAVLAHALLTFPNGRLGSRANRALIAVAYLDVLVLQGIAVLLDPLTRWHSAHPPNLALVSAHATLATSLEELEAAIAFAVELAVAVVLVRRLRAATPPARRQLVPVFYGGAAGLLLLAVGLALVPLSSRAAVVGLGLGLLAALALPIGFLTLLVRGRLSRAAVGELLVELRGGVAQPNLQDALRRALGDPALELAQLQPDGRFVGADGSELLLPGPGDGRVVTQVRYLGEQIGVLVHDRSLRMHPELLDAVSAAAGVALATKRALETVQRVEHRNRALLEAIPDPMIRVARDGTYLDVRAEDPSQLIGPPAELIGRNVYDLLPRELANLAMACVERALETGRVSTVEYEILIGGVPRWKESRMTPSGEGEVVSIVRDFTEQRRAQAELQRLAEEQAALRRVATLVAGDAPPEQVFQDVTEEASRLLRLQSALLVRYEDARTATIVGRYGDEPEEFQLGSSIDLDEGAAFAVLRAGAPVRVNYEELGGAIAPRMLEYGFQSAVGVPITVAGATWGALIAGERADEALPGETDRRLEAFAELVALAVASAHARDELTASRRRIVEASDAERRRLERNLHDGAQQRLVALSVALRLAQAKLRDAPAEAEELLEAAAEELGEALTELRELAQGIHPAVLTERGLADALQVLAARAPLPVALDMELPKRLPGPVEAAAYYVASEALANVVKHAGASSAVMRASQTRGHAVIEVTDDGVGGAALDGGTGLRGLRDRVETLRGRLEVESLPGSGTLVRAELPLI